MRMQRRDLDEGFSMIEVIIAMVMIGIVASSALWFFINGMRTSSNLGRQQTAISVATSAMEQTFVVSPKLIGSTGVFGLVAGRSASAVSAALSADGVSSAAGIANTYPQSDPAGGTPVLPISETVNRAGVTYTVYTLVGSCYRTLTVNGAAQDCDKVSGWANEPPTTPAGQARMLRVIVVVTWEPLGDECATVCSYDVSTLVDPSSDLVWNRVFDPEAVDDILDYDPVPAPVVQTIVVLGNDALGSVPVNPVKTITNNLPALNKAGKLVGPTSTGTYDFTPPAQSAWISGIFNFTYQIHDIPGKTSLGTVYIRLHPKTADDVATATVGVPKALNLFGNDLGSPNSLTIVNPPVNGVLSFSGTNGLTVTYTGSTPGPDQFTYFYKDASGQESPAATVSISVEAVSASDVVAAANYRPSATTAWIDVSAALRNGAPSSSKITVSGEPIAVDTLVANGQLLVDGVPYTGGTLTGDKVEFQPSEAAVGEWTFPFALSVGSYTTPVVKATMRVEVKAVNDSGITFKRNGTRTYLAGQNDTPTLWGSGSGVTVTLGSISCGSWVPNASGLSTTDLDKGQVSMLFPNSSQSGCTAKYTLSASGSSATATISYKTTFSG